MFGRARCRNGRASLQLRTSVSVSFSSKPRWPRLPEKILGWKLSLRYNAGRHKNKIRGQQKMRKGLREVLCIFALAATSVISSAQNTSTLQASDFQRLRSVAQ